MGETTAQMEVRPAVNEAGVLTTLMDSGSSLMEKAVAGGLDVVKSVRGELFRAAGGGIDWLDALHHSAFKIGREALQRLDGLTLDAVQGAESLANATIRAVRVSGEAVGDVASTTVESLVRRRAAATPRAA
jgi:hypothetical protein